MTREEVIRLGLLTEEQLRSCQTMSNKEWANMEAKDNIYRTQIDSIFQELLERYEDIFE